MSYTVWVDYGTEGWQPSGNLTDLDEVLNFITKDTYGHGFRITEDVDVTLKIRGQGGLDG